MGGFFGCSEGRHAELGQPHAKQNKSYSGNYVHQNLARYCDTIAAIPPYSAIPFRGQLDVRCPPYFGLHASKCQCDRGLYGGYSAIGCDTGKTKSDRVWLDPTARYGGGIALVPPSTRILDRGENSEKDGAGELVTPVGRCRSPTGRTCAVIIQCGVWMPERVPEREGNFSEVFRAF